MKTEADIAVVVTSHNYAHFLGACLDSILAQTCQPKEIVVVDDASNDGAEAVVRARDGVRFFSVDFGNGNRARNFGFEQTTSPYVVFFDADNEMLPDFLAKLSGKLLNDPSAAFAYCDRVNFAHEDVSWYPHAMGPLVAGPFDREKLRQSNYIDLASVIRREWFPGFDEQLRRYQDWDLWLHIVLLNGGYGVYVPEPLFHYRVHGQNISRTEDRSRAVWHLRRKYGIGWGRVPGVRHWYWMYRLLEKIGQLGK